MRQNITYTVSVNTVYTELNLFFWVSASQTILVRIDVGTYGLTFLGSCNPCASTRGLSGGGWGRSAGSDGCWALWTGDWITPFIPPSTPFMFSCRAELLDWPMLPKVSFAPRLKPFSMGWPKDAGLCWGGGVPWKESDELLRDGLPEWSSWIRTQKQNLRCLSWRKHREDVSSLKETLYHSWC